MASSTVEWRLCSSPAMVREEMRERVPVGGVWASTGTLSPYRSMTSRTLLRNAFATGVRANMARRWQPRREKMRTLVRRFPVVPISGTSTISMSCVISGVNSSEFRSYNRDTFLSSEYPKARASSEERNQG